MAINQISTESSDSTFPTQPDTMSTATKEILTAKVADEPRYVSMTAEERKSGAYGSASLQKALEGIHQDGFVVLKGVADLAHVNALNKYMVAEAGEILEAKLKDENTEWNQGVPCKCCHRTTDEISQAHKLCV